MFQFLIGRVKINLVEELFTGKRLFQFLIGRVKITGIKTQSIK